MLPMDLHDIKRFVGPRKAKTPFLITETAFCAEGGTRTRTGLLPHAPETCVSTSFTTSALNRCAKIVILFWTLQAFRVSKREKIAKIKF